MGINTHFFSLDAVGGGEEKVDDEEGIIDFEEFGSRKGSGSMASDVTFWNGLLFASGLLVVAVVGVV